MKPSLKVSYFQRRFLKRTAITNELTEVVLFSQAPLKMATPEYLLPSRTVRMLSAISPLVRVFLLGRARAVLASRRQASSSNDFSKG